MTKPIDHTQLLQLRAIFEAGFNRCAEAAGLIQPYISLNQAHKLYGTGTVNRWIKEGLITPIRDGSNTSKYRIKRSEIEEVAITENRASYYKK